jgi:signal transduction histidine kinase
LMFSITLIAESVGAAWKRNPVEGEARVTRLLELSQTAQAEMRSLLAELRASEPEPEQASETPSRTFELSKVHRDGLPAALKAYAATHADDSLRIDVDTHQYPLGKTPRTYEEAMYRIAQEALSNAIRHSGARQIEIKIGAMDDAIYLIVADDGRGFALDAVVPSASGASGLGLHTMRDRATALNGSLEISTAPGSGTTVHVRLPRVSDE